MLFDIDDETRVEAAAALGLQDAGLTRPGDVAEPADVAAAVARVLERFGRIDALINNAGIAVQADPRDQPGTFTSAGVASSGIAR